MGVDILDELLKHNDITEEDFPPQLTSEDLPPEEMAAAEDILDELLKSGNMSLDDFDLANEVSNQQEMVEQMKVEDETTTEEASNQDESILDAANDSGFI